MTRAILLYAAISAVAIALIAAGLVAFVYRLPDERSAVWISGIVALTVQVGAFALARSLAKDGQGIAGWGIGAIVSLLTLVGFGLVARGTALPTGAALVSMASFLFVTELIEPPLLNV
jgi:hypothetical protein